MINIEQVKAALLSAYLVGILIFVGVMAWHTMNGHSHYVLPEQCAQVAIERHFDEHREQLYQEAILIKDFDIDYNKKER